MTFRVGEKVRVRDGCGWWKLNAGEIYTVGEVLPSGEYFRVVEYMGTHPHHNVGGYRLEPVLTAPRPTMILSEDPTTRKNTPITSGVLDYFPRALAAVAQCSKAGNDQHNPGQPLHWAKGKSTDHADCIARHLIDRDSVDTDGIAHAAKLAWRALAYLETKLEQEASK